MPRRGEVWLANLNPPRGTEPGKTRPVLVVQAQALLDAGHPSTLIVPLTTHVVPDTQPLRVHVPTSAGVRHGSDLLIDQVRSIDNRRLIDGPLTQLPPSLMHAVSAAIRDVLDLDEG